MTRQDLLAARVKLGPNNLEGGLPGRESQRDELYNFLFERLKIRRTTVAKKARVSAGLVADINKHMNKTMFVCGVPGTGKTATVIHVIDELKKLLKRRPAPIHKFDMTYVNGQFLASPERVYSEILHNLTNETCNAEKAQQKLDSLFRDSTSGYKLIVIDELDLLYSEKRSSVFYSLFDWPSCSDSKMILVAIANAMDLPERFMRGRISSRLGWNKLVFEAYTSSCLAEILSARLSQGLLDKTFDKNAVIVATKRVGRTTGDARRILDLCCSAVDKALKENVPKVTAAIIDQVGHQNLDSQRSDYLNYCSPLEIYVLKCILDECSRVGEENVEALGVYNQLTKRLSKDDRLKNYHIPSEGYQAILNSLAGINLIQLEGDKTLLEKRLFIKDSSDILREVILAHNIIY